MSNESITIHNAETGEIIVKELTDAEQAELMAERQAARAAKAEAAEAKVELETKKQEVLAKLGLTSDEVAALLA